MNSMVIKYKKLNKKWFKRTNVYCMVTTYPCVYMWVKLDCEDNAKWNITGLSWVYLHHYTIMLKSVVPVFCIMISCGEYWTVLNTHMVQ